MKLRLLIIPLLLVAACKKQPYPESEEVGESPYYFTASVNGRQADLRAGRDNYYMYTAVTDGQNNVARVSGDLRVTGCTTCTQRLQVFINASHTGPLAPGDSSVKPRVFPFQTDIYPQVYDCSFGATNNKSISKATWLFDGQPGTSGASTTHVFNKPGRHSVCVQVTSDNGCVSYICNDIATGDNALNANVRASVTGESVAFLAQVAGGEAPYSYKWDFGDGSGSTQQEPVHAYKVPGGYPVKLTVTDALGKTTSVNYNAVTGSDISSCAANFTMSLNSAPKLNLSAVEVRWTDESGVTYTSVGEQPGSEFRITAVEPGGVNENGETFLKVRVAFHCRLYNGSTVISVENAEAVLGLGYR
jgi:PKD repeat protein